MKRRTKIPKTPPALVRVPAPEFLEAPSSWLARLALYQGTPIRSLLSHLQLPLSGNLDLQFASACHRTIADRAGVSLKPLQVTLQVLRNLKFVDPNGQRFLLKEGGVGQFRYCPLCFKEQTTPHVPIHWRIRTWRFCPLHHCLMETGCSKCGAATVLPASFVSGGPAGEGVAYLKDCVRCGKSLAAVEPCPVRRTGPGAVPDGDWCLLKNGRAVLAALVSGNVQTKANERNRGLGHLVLLDKRGLLPRREGWLAPEQMRQRLRAAAAKVKASPDASDDGS